MARQRNGGNGGVRAPDTGKGDGGWPVECTCAVATVLVFLALSKLSYLVSPLFIGSCTTLSGMCTPADCTCVFPFRRRELVTQDSQICYQCIAELCPEVAEGEETCSTSECECEDPAWFRHDAKIGGKPCWQCVRPAVNWTLRTGGSDDKSCIAAVPVPKTLTLPAPTPAAEDAEGKPVASADSGDVGAKSATAQGGVAAAAAVAATGGKSAAPTARLVVSSNRSDCLSFRYNGAWIVEKRKGLGCLAWQSFGAYWGLSECDARDNRMRFKKLLTSSDSSAEASASDMHAANSGDIYCAGRNSSEFCVEVAEHICTAEEDQCSTRPCRCEDLSWQRQELQTLNGSLCYSCAPPMERCTTSQDSCTAGPCDCENSNHVATLVEDSSLFPVGVQPGAKCFRCAPQGRAGYFTHMSTVAICFTVVCFATCLIGGRFLRFSEGAGDGASRKSRRNRAGGPGAEARGTWSERWAQNLEDFVWGLYDWFCDKPLTFMRPGLRVAEAGLNRLLDICDLALEPFYCAADFVWDLVAALHEHLVAMVQAARCGGLRGLKAALYATWAPAWCAQGKSESSGGAGSRKGRRKEQYDAEVEEAAASVEGLVAEATKVHLQARSKKAAGGAQSSRQPKAGASAAAAELAMEQVSRSDASSFSTANLDWDPLGLQGDSPQGSASGSGAQALGSGEQPVPIMVQKDESGRVVLSAVPNMSVADVRLRAAQQISAPLPINTTPPQQQQQPQLPPQPTPTPTLSRAQRKLQQRRAARAAAGAEAAAAPASAGGVAAAASDPEPPAPIDDSWIDEMEQEEKAKSAKKAKKNKKANKEASAAAAKGSSTPQAAEKATPAPAPAAPVEVEDESEEEEEEAEKQAPEAAAPEEEVVEEVAPEEPEVVAPPPPAPEQPASGNSKKNKKGREAAAKAKAAEAARSAEEESKAKRKKESERQSAQALSAMVAQEGGELDREKLLGEVMRGLCLLSESEQVAVAESAALLAARKNMAATAKAAAPEPQAAVAESAALLAARKNMAATAKAAAPEPQEAAVVQSAADEKARRRPWRQPEVQQVAAGVTTAKAQPTPEPESKNADLEELPPGLENFGGGDTVVSADPLKKTDGFQERSSWRSAGGSVRRERGGAGDGSGGNGAVPQVSQALAAEASPTRSGGSKEAAKETPPAAPASAGNSRRAAPQALTQQAQPQAQPQATPSPTTSPPAASKDPSRRVKPKSPPAAAAAPGGPSGSKGATGGEGEGASGAAAALSTAGKAATGSTNYAQVVANWAKKEPLSKEQGRRAGAVPGAASSFPVARGPGTGSAAAAAATAATLAAMASAEEGASASGTTEWPELSQQGGSTRLPASKSGGSNLEPDAPEFVPMAMQAMDMQAMGLMDNEDEPRGSRRRRGGRKRGIGGPSDIDGACDPAPAEGSPDWITTVMISGISSEYTPQSFKEQLDMWGLLGCYNLFLMPADRQTNLGFGYALVNFIDPAFAMLCQWLLLACQFPGASAPAETQGLEACIALAGVYASDETMNAPVAIISEPVPSQWAVNATNELLSPQFRGQFRKTKMCSFFRKGRCTMGSECPFAHSSSELCQPPDLSHTKLCYNHFRGKCTDEKCRYAHGSHKLRTVKALEHETAVWTFDPASMWGMPGTGWPMMGVGGDYGPSPETLLNVLNGTGSLIPDEDDSEEEGSDDSRRGLAFAPGCAKARGASTGRTAHTGEVVEGIRERGTFMEALQVREEEPMGSMRRSWSDSDLPAFRAAMQDMDLL